MRQKKITRKSILSISGYIGLSLITIVWLLPIIWMIISAFRDPGDPFYSGILPKQFTLLNFTKVLTNEIAMTSFRNSLVVSSLAALIVIVIASLAAYGFSRYRFRGYEGLQILLLIVRLFPGILLAIALFKLAGILKVYDTYVPLILANALFNLPFAVWILRAAFQNLPIEIEEAAWMDGATRLQGIQKIMLPLLAPSLAATAAYVFLLTWNEYLFAVSFIRTPSKQLVTTHIATYIGQYHIDMTFLITISLMASLPMLLLFVLIQRYIVSGIQTGAVR